MTSFDTAPSLSRRGLWLVALFGVVVSFCLHMYFVGSWARYAASIPPHRLQQTGNRIPPPHMAETKLSVRHGSLLVAGVAAGVALVCRRRVLASLAAFTAGVVVVQIISSVYSNGMGNLWPIAFIGIAILLVIPIAIGSTLSLAIIWATRSARRT